MRKGRALPATGLVVLTIVCGLFGLPGSSEQTARGDDAAAPAAHATEPHSDEHHGSAAGHALPGPITTSKMDVDLALWSVVTFVVFLAVLTRFAWKPLTAALDERETKVRQDILAAEASRKQAEQMLSDHAKKLADVQNEVREMLAEARRDADRARTELVSAAQAEADSLRQRALADIERARDQALDELFATMASTVSRAAEQVVGRSLTGDDHDRLVRDAVGQFAVPHA